MRWRLWAEGEIHGYALCLTRIQHTPSSARHQVIRAITAPKSTKPRRCFNVIQPLAYSSTTHFLIALTLPALIHVWLRSDLPDIGKSAWTLAIVFLPGLGPLLWYCWRLSMKIMQRS